MKSLGASLLLVALLTVARPAGADPTYGGTLAAHQPYSITIDHATVNQKSMVTAIYYLGGARPATKFDILPVAANSRVTLVQEIPRNTRLIVLEIASPADTSFNCEIAQVGGLSFPALCGGGRTFTFDLQ